MAFCATLVSVIGAARTIAGQIIEINTGQELKKQLEELQKLATALEKQYASLSEQGNIQRDRLVNWAEILKVTRDVRLAVDAIEEFLPLVTPPSVPPGTPPIHAPLQGVPAQVKARALLSDLEEPIGHLRALGIVDLLKAEREATEKLRDSIRVTFGKMEDALAFLQWRQLGELAGDMRGLLGGLQGTAWAAFSPQAAQDAPAPVPAPFQ